MESLNPQMTVPAVCRIPGRGTAFLVATGVLMTTTTVVPNARDASRMTAVFFEGSKKPTVEVKLLPERLYFSAVYPEHVNYCIVACETNGIFNVMPIKVPLIKSEWPTTNEGDTLLLMQHWGSKGLSDVCGGATARFDEVLRRRDDVLYLKATGQNMSCAGCPAFNAESLLVGVQSQLEVMGEGLISRVLSIVTIVKHLFANAMCSRLQQCPTPDSVWDTWYVPNDTTRVISIMANFKNKDVLSMAVRRLCEHTAKSELLEGVVACGGTGVIIASLAQFKEDEELARSALRSLWDISVGDVNNRPHIVEAGGVETILDVLELYPKNQEIAEFGSVVLFNLTLDATTVNAEWASRCVRVMIATLQIFVGMDVLQKFVTGLLLNLVKAIPTLSEEIVSATTMDHLNALVAMRSKNVLLMEHVAPLLSALARAEWQNAAMRPCIPRIIDLMVEHHTNHTILLSGNNALWSLGASVENRVDILQHPNGTKVLGGSVHTLLGIRR